ncbi:MAG: hypothetical protein WA093_00790 [Minisyncoccales bacterium]|jgi:hypothetical protein
MNEVEKEKEAIEMIAASEPLATVYRYMISGEFAPAPEIEVGKNETVIGELIPLEKAVRTAERKIADDHKKMVDGAMRSNKISCKKYKKCVASGAVVSSLDGLFWVLVRCRLGDITYEGSGIGLRKGYKIVSIPYHKPSAEPPNKVCLRFK